MNAEQLFKDIGDIVVFPGTLDELNSLSEDKYRILPMESIKKYLTGYLVPDAGEFAGMENVIKATNPGDGKADEIMGYIRNLLGKPEIIEQDLRLTAKRMGADGLIHLKLYNKDSLYIGVPVVRI